MIQHASGLKIFDKVEGKQFFKYIIRRNDVNCKIYRVFLTKSFLQELSKVFKDSESLLNSIADENRVLVNHDMIEKEYRETIKKFLELTKFLLLKSERHE